jgi:hypothetical protein
VVAVTAAAIAAAVFPHVRPNLEARTSSNAFPLTSQLLPAFTFTRPSAAHALNAKGALVECATDIPAFEHSPTTNVPRGIAIFGVITNLNPNPRAEAAAAGSPGTLPAGWSVSTLPSGITRTVVGATSEDGIECLDVRFSGTPGSTLATSIHFMTNTGATPGQGFTGAFNAKISAGSATNLAFQQKLVTRQANQSGVDVVTPAVVLTSGRLSAQRFSANIANAGALTAFVQGGMNIVFTSSMPVDVTLRIGGTTLTQTSFTPPIILPPAFPDVGNGQISVRGIELLRLSNAMMARFGDATRGTIVIDAVMWRSIASSNLARVVQLNDGTVNNTIDLYVTGATVAAQVAIAAVQQGVTPGYAPLVGERARYVLRWRPGVVRHAANGNLYGEITTTLPSITQVWFGNRPDGQRPLNCNIERVAIYPDDISNERMQTVSVLGAPL